MRIPPMHFLLAAGIGLLVAFPLNAQQCPTSVPVQGAPLAGALQVFPADNWWNLDIRDAPVDAASSSFIAFINNGGTRRLHPDFGGEESPGSVATYGFPYAVVDASQPRQAVLFNYADESDGVDHATGQSIPFYPIPAQAISQPHWVEGGSPGNIDERSDGDRHLLVIDCAGKSLYELYNVYYNAAQGQWYGGSGAFFDLTHNGRRPDTWTSADAAGLAIFPGLVRYDEAANAAVAEINHAFRVTVRSSNGYVYPASHAAGSTAGALPMGARLRLKALVNGVDPATRTTDPTSRKVFRAMQKYGLIVADNGSDMFISGTFDVRWNNDLLNPAFSTLSAGDFEVIQRGWNPPPAMVPALNAVSASPNPVVGGSASTGTVTLSSAAPTGGARVALSSASPAFSVPASVTVAGGAGSATFAITTNVVGVTTMGTLSATYNGVTRRATLTVDPAPPALSIANASISEGNSGTRLLTFTVRLTRASTTAVRYNIATANGTARAGSDYVARNLTGQSIAAGQTSRSFAVTIDGDTTGEANETLLVNLGGAVGASIADGQAVGTIVNDDGPTLSIANVTVTEGNSGAHLATFTVRLSPASATTVTYDIFTGYGSAKAGSDYVAHRLDGQAIAPGATSRTFTVAIRGDITPEPDEAFLVNLAGASGASIFDSQAIGKIVNDD